MGKRADRKITRKVKIERSGTGELHDPRRGIRVTYEMMGPYGKAAVDRVFKSHYSAEKIANA